jgi:hypothetical protein
MIHLVFKSSWWVSTHGAGSIFVGVSYTALDRRTVIPPRRPTYDDETLRLSDVLAMQGVHQRSQLSMEGLVQRQAGAGEACTCRGMDTIGK